MGLMYREDLKIDQSELDECCLRQPILFDHYVQDLASFCKNRDEIKVAMERFSANLDGVIREAASAEGKKITETMIQNEITRNLQYADLQQKYVNICSDVKEAEVIRDAFNQRREMLKLLVELYISGYWSSVETKIVGEKRTEALKNKLEQKMKEDKKSGID